MNIGKKVAQWALIVFLCILLSIWLFPPLIKLADILSNSMVSDKLPDTSAATKMFTNPFLSIKLLGQWKYFKDWLLIDLVVWGGIISLFFVAKTKNKIEVNNGKTINYSKDNGTYGTAQWMPIVQLNKIEKYISTKDQLGIIYGQLKAEPKKLVILPKKSWYNRNIAVYGSSGSGKSRTFARPNIFNLALAGESMIITDPKGELAQDTIQMLEDFGYTCKVLNMVNLVHSDRWNPLLEITDDISAQTFAQVVIDNTTAKNAKLDEFWSKTEMNLLKALALYVTMELPKSEANMASLYSLISTRDAKKTDRIFDTLDEDHPALKPYNIYKQASENVRTGVVIGLGTRLQIFQSKIMQKVTEVSDIDIILPGKQKCAYFVIVPDSESTFDFIAGLYFSFSFIKLIRLADYNGGKLPIQVNFILDEFPNIAKINDFPKKIATIRSRGMNTFVIFQQIAQLQNRYPNNEWAEILGNCDTQIFLGCNDEVTAKFISDRLGQATIADYSVSRQQGFEGLFDFGKRSDKFSKRMLLNPDEVYNYPNEEAVLIMRGQDPLQLIKYDYTKHKLSKKMRPKPLKEYHKEWATEFEYLERINEEMYSIINIKGDINTSLIPDDDSESETASDKIDNTLSIKNKDYDKWQEDIKKGLEKKEEEHIDPKEKIENNNSDITFEYKKFPEHKQLDNDKQPEGKFNKEKKGMKINDFQNDNKNDLKNDNIKPRDFF